AARNVSRKPTPPMLVAVDTTTPDEFLLCKTVLEQVRWAAMVGDRAGLEQLARDLADLNDLPPALREALAKKVAKVLADLPDKADPDAAVLARLGGPARNLKLAYIGPKPKLVAVIKGRIDNLAPVKYARTLDQLRRCFQNQDSFVLLEWAHPLGDKTF